MAETVETKGESNASVSPKTSPSKKEIDVATQALNHFAQGRRHLLVNDISSAVNSLQEACRLLAEQYGETAPECGDAYYYYGRALLELARIENGVLGNALEGVPDGEDMDSSQVENPEKLTEEEKELVSIQVDEALQENYKKTEEKMKSQNAAPATSNEPPTAIACQNGDAEAKKTTEETDGAIVSSVKVDNVEKMDSEGLSHTEPSSNDTIKMDSEDLSHTEQSSNDTVKMDSEGVVHTEKSSDTDKMESVDASHTEKSSDTEKIELVDASHTEKSSDTEKIESVDASHTEKSSDAEKMESEDASHTEKSSDVEKMESEDASHTEKSSDIEKIESVDASHTEKSSDTEKIESVDASHAEKTSDIEKIESEDASLKGKPSHEKDSTTNEETEASEGADKMDSVSGSKSTVDATSLEDKTDVADIPVSDKVDKSDTEKGEMEVEMTDPATQTYPEVNSVCSFAGETSKCSNENVDSGIADDNEDVEDSTTVQVKEAAEVCSAETKSESDSEAKQAVVPEHNSADAQADSETADTCGQASIAKVEATAVKENASENIGKEAGLSSESKKEDIKAESESKPEADKKNQEDGKKSVLESANKDEEDGKEEMQTEEKTAKNVKKDGSTEGEEEDEEEDGEAESQEEGEAADGEGTQEEEEGEKTEEDEEVSNLQLAWEMLELAKFIFEKHDKKSQEMSLKIAQVYLKLGEVGLENENYIQSVDDFSHCLKVQTDFMEPDNRCLAETHYQLGVAHSFSDDYDNAIGSFQSALNVIETRIENLKKKAEEKTKWSEEQRKKYAAECEDPFYSEEKEIEELNQLIPEIKEKIVDMEQMKTDSKEKIQKIAKELTLAKSIGRTSCSSPGESNAGGFSSPSKMGTPQTPKLVTNISHLIRRKRKPDEDVNPDDTKKARGESVENEGVTPNGSATNGQKSPEKMETEEKTSKECDDSKVTEASA